MSRKWAIVLAFVLTPLVVATIILVSVIADNGQEFALAFAGVGWVVLVSALKLPEDAEDDYRALKQRIRDHRTVAASIVTGVAVLFYLSFETILSPHVPGGSWAGLAVQISLPLWLFAGLLYLTRPFMYGHQWFWGVLAALFAIVIPFVLFKIVGPLVPMWEAILIIVGPALLMLVPLVLARERRVRAAASWATSKLREDGAEKSNVQEERSRGALAVVSIGCAVASSLLLLGSAIRVPIERRLIETSQVAERGAVLAPIDIADAADLPRADRRALLERYSPVLRLHETEGWIAMDASEVLNAIGASFEDECSDRDEQPCDEVPLEGSLARLDGLDPHPPVGSRVFAAGAIYPRLVPVSAEVGELGEEVPGFARSTRWLAQYWLFYPYNDWGAKTAVGRLKQVHGGDWEWVGVGLDKVGAPVFVAYSAHCAGSWRPWSAAASVALSGTGVMVGGTVANPASHPLTIVARGSHANYPTPGTREPDWGSCLFEHAGAQALRLLTFTVSGREETPELGPFQVPAVLPEEETERVGTRALWWGEGGQTRLGPIELVADEHGPASPAYQEGWTKPIETIFASDWECDAAGACGDE